MRGLTAEERRAERLQSFTFLGLLADDVALATIHYPSLSEKEDAALREFDQLLDAIPVAAGAAEKPVFPRRRSMSDPTPILFQAAQIAREENQESQLPPDLEALRQPVRRLIERAADSDALQNVREFAEVLGRVTLTLAEALAGERGAEDWISTTSSFSAV